MSQELSITNIAEWHCRDPPSTPTEENWLHSIDDSSVVTDAISTGHSIGIGTHVVIACFPLIFNYTVWDLSLEVASILNRPCSLFIGHHVSDHRLSKWQVGSVVRTQFMNILSLQTRSAISLVSFLNVYIYSWDSYVDVWIYYGVQIMNLITNSIFTAWTDLLSPLTVTEILYVR